MASAAAAPSPAALTNCFVLPARTSPAAKMPPVLVWKSMPFGDARLPAQADALDHQHIEAVARGIDRGGQGGWAAAADDQNRQRRW